MAEPQVPQPPPGPPAARTPAVGTLPQMSRGEFAQAIRQKVTTEAGDPYGDLSDEDLVDAVTAKHPIYQSWITKVPALPGQVPLAKAPAQPDPGTFLASPPSTRRGSAKTGGMATQPPPGASLLDRSPEGAVQALSGAKHLVTGEGGRWNAGSDILEGGMEAGEPLMVLGTLSKRAGFALVRGVVAGTIGTQFAHSMLTKAGVSPEASRFWSDLLGLGTGVAAAEAPRIRTAWVERPQPIPGAAVGPPNRAEGPSARAGGPPVGPRPQVADIPAGQAAQGRQALDAAVQASTTRRTAEAQDFAQGWAQAQAGEAAAQTAVSAQQMAERHAFELRVQGGMDPMEAVRLERQGDLGTGAPPQLALPPAPPDVRAIIAYPPGEVVVPPNPNLTDIIRPELVGGPRRVIGAAPPVPIEDQLGEALAGQLESQPQGGPPRLDRVPNKLRAGPPPSLEQTQLALKLRGKGKRMAGPIPGEGAASIAQSPGGAVTERGQSRLADLAEHEPYPLEADQDARFQEAHQAAKEEGFEGSPAEAYRRYQEAVSRAQDMTEYYAEMAEESTYAQGLRLLRAIAKAGGIGPSEGDSGEFGRLLETRDMTRTPQPGEYAKGRKAPKGMPQRQSLRRAAKSHAHQGTIAGVANVIRIGSTSINRAGGRRYGMTLSQMVEHLSQYPEWVSQGITKDDMDGHGLADLVEQAARAVREGPEDLSPVEPDLGEGWWRRTGVQDRAAALADHLSDDTFNMDAEDLANAHQEILRLLGPGGDGGPPMRGESPQGDLFGEEQPSLPGAEGVRGQEIPTPEVADAPFGLTPPPSKPGAAPTQPSLLERLSKLEMKGRKALGEGGPDQEGVLILNVPPGDPIGLKRWLGTIEATHGDDPWYHRVLQALEDDNPGRAWRLAAAASARDLAAVGAGRISPEQRKALKGAEFARAAGRSDMLGPQGGAGSTSPDAVSATTPPPIRPGQRGQGITGGAQTGGVLRPPPPRRPLPASATDLLLGKTIQQSLLSHTDHSLITLIEGNQDTAFKYFRQVAEQALMGLNSKEAKQYLGLSEIEIASGFERVISESARNLARLKHTMDAHADEIGLLRRTPSGELAHVGPGAEGFMAAVPDWVSEEFASQDPSVHIGGGGTMRLYPGETPASATLDVIAEAGKPLDRAMALTAVSKPDPARVGKATAVLDFSRTLLISTWRNMTRNGITQSARYGVGMLDEAFAAAAEATFGNAKAAGRHARAAKELGLELTPRKDPSRTLGVSLGRPQSGPSGFSARHAEMAAIYDYLSEAVADLPPESAAKTLDALGDFPEHATNFLGWDVSGEQGAQGSTNSKFFDALIDPKVRNAITVLNRTAEFAGRAPALDAYVRAGLQDLGVDPEALFEPEEYTKYRAWQGEAAAKLAQGEEDLPLFQPSNGDPAISIQQLDRVYEHAAWRSLDYTFAGGLLEGSFPALLVRLVQKVPGFQAVMPFPKFGIVTASRFIYDHSPVALFDLLRAPFGNVPGFGTTAYGRVGKGINAAYAERVALPELSSKLIDAKQAFGKASKDLVSAAREHRVQQKLMDRAQARAAQGTLDPSLDRTPDIQDRLDTLAEQITEAKTARAAARQAQKQLGAEITNAQGKVQQREQANLPNFAEYLGRMSTGLTLLGGAIALRLAADQGTSWDEWTVTPDDAPPYTANLRGYNPMVQYMLPADVLIDIGRHTDWEGYRAEMAGWSAALSPVEAAGVLWNHYEGKYTQDKLNQDFFDGFLTISRKAGTEKNLWDLATQQGSVGPSDVNQAIVGTIGQFLARWLVNPAVDFASGIAAQVDPEEAKLRLPPRSSMQQKYGPLAAPIAAVPGLRRLVPPTLSQTTGEPISTDQPLMRTFAGITTRRRDPLEAEFHRIGMPSKSVYIPKTGDQGLDDTLARTYAEYLQNYLPEILASPEYHQVGSPASQRDYLSKILGGLRRAAIAETKEILGPLSVKAAQEGPEEKRSRIHREALLKRLAADQPQVIEGEPQEPEPGGPPPGPPR